jgi:hypothetical protein
MRLVVTWVNDIQDHRGTTSLYTLTKTGMFMVSSDRDERLGRALIWRDKLRMRRSYHLLICTLGGFVIFYDIIGFQRRGLNIKKRLLYDGNTKYGVL